MRANALIEPSIEPSLLLLPPYYCPASLLLLQVEEEASSIQQQLLHLKADSQQRATAAEKGLAHVLYYCIFTTASLLLNLYY